jgi:hypothetical protein
MFLKYLKQARVPLNEYEFPNLKIANVQSQLEKFIENPRGSFDRKFKKWLNELLEPPIPRLWPKELIEYIQEITASGKPVEAKIENRVTSNSNE